MDTKIVTATSESGEGLRPWRKRALQIITTDIWRKDSLEEIVPLKQVAGHGSIDAKQAILTNKKGCILKPVQAPPRGLREKKFYEEIFKSEGDTASLLKPFLPKYYGSCKKKSGDGQLVEFLMIENLSQDMSKPCIMDIKIGAKTYGPDATPEKIAHQDASYKGTKKPFGFSVLGMSLHSGTNKETFRILNKDYGKSLNSTNIEDFLVNYLDSSSDPSAAKVLSRLFVGKLLPLVELFNTQTMYHLFGSSLLFVYDADQMAKFIKAEISENQLSESVAVTMIDFAHVWDGEGSIDDNYLFGLTKLRDTFEQFSK